MSLTATLRTASSGLNAAQASLRAVSDNIANVNTPGYVRKAVNQSSLVVDGAGMGVKVDGVKRITDQYLQMASLTASSDSERWGAVSQYLDNAQSLFGDPGKDGFFFNRLDKIFAAFATAADDPSSTLLRSQALSTVEDFLTEADRINGQVVALGKTVETRISADVDRANSLLDQISKMNADIKRASVVGADASGSENIQSQLLDELAGLMNVRVAPREGGGVDVRSTEGVLLAGDDPAKLVYHSSDSTPGYITAQPAGSTSTPAINITSGEIKGLLEVRDIELPKIYDQMGEFVSKAVDQLNAANNDAAAYPSPTTMVGRNTGLDLTSAVSGFTGTSTIAIVNPQGVLQRKIDIDFTAGTMSVNGAAGTPFTPATFLTSLNTALGGAGSATFTNGALTLNGAAGNGLAIDEGTSAKTGRGFSHFFGLNDLIKNTGQTNYATGLTAASPHGFTPGDQISLQISYPDGRPITNVSVTVPAAANMSDLLASLNNNSTGVGLYGAYGLDANGVLAFTPNASADAKVSVITDNTARGAGGPSISQLFGLGVQERSTRASRFQVSAIFNADPTKMAMGKLDTTVAVGQVAVRPGDGQGALAISASGDINTVFQAAGSLGQVTMTVSRYASEFGGAVGRGAAAAETRKSSAEAVATEATNRRQSVEGVNLDEELVNLTTYQQAFNASARMIQAVSDLYDVLLRMV
ncbi:MAG: flagellar hook-associated protein FlgK [Alphaproteobacteria bacterium]|nr:flagellar hook-associated protein FlgK [Alphaproteobacteria bacterium]MBU1513410.1 flagellar hook-associated protein FlgK [Alphaproteobacteria bacterium]MBU2096402.1 flagellar hook-associated protein FlgK [Alphaproteobacteria bacterium]MBU2149906.1 flagellar hook-associated protein FlgK [Alphaproteobacteria bacterium]MBU2308188.1 flagellar hook-associated protein FlgK [Alphaproteobacteria bacterium]